MALWYTAILVLVAYYCQEITTFTPSPLQCGDIGSVVEISSFPHILRGVPIEYSSAKQVSISDVNITFADKTPSPRVAYYVDNTKHAGLTLHWNAIYEKDAINPNAAGQYNNISLENQQWDVFGIQTDECEGVFFRTNLTGGSQYEIAFYVFKQETALEYGENKTFSFPTNGVKVAFTLRNYTYTHNDSKPSFNVLIEFDDDFSAELDPKYFNAIDFALHLEHQEVLPILFSPITTKRNAPINDEVPRTIITNNGSSVNFTFFNYALYSAMDDPMPKEVDFRSSSDIWFATNHSGIASISVNITFVGYFKGTGDIFYDPDIRFLLSLNDQDGDFGDSNFGSGDGSLSGGQIAAIVICSLVFGVVVVIAVIVVITILVLKRRALMASDTLSL